MILLTDNNRKEKLLEFWLISLGQTMINRTQFKISLYLGFFISLVRLVILLIDHSKANNDTLQTILTLFHTNVWFMPIIFGLLYLFVVTSCIYLSFRVLNYIINLFR